MPQGMRVRVDSTWGLPSRISWALGPGWAGVVRAMEEGLAGVAKAVEEGLAGAAKEEEGLAGVGKAVEAMACIGNPKHGGMGMTRFRVLM